jgi:hypothetical protein
MKYTKAVYDNKGVKRDKTYQREEKETATLRDSSGTASEMAILLKMLYPAAEEIGSIFSRCFFVKRSIVFIISRRKMPHRVFSRSFHLEHLLINLFQLFSFVLLTKFSS